MSCSVRNWITKRWLFISNQCSQLNSSVNRDRAQKFSKLSWVYVWVSLIDPISLRLHCSIGNDFCLDVATIWIVFESEDFRPRIDIGKFLPLEGHQDNQRNLLQMTLKRYLFGLSSKFNSIVMFHWLLPSFCPREKIRRDLLIIVPWPDHT